MSIDKEIKKNEDINKLFLDIRNIEYNINELSNYHSSEIEMTISTSRRFKKGGAHIYIDEYSDFEFSREIIEVVIKDLKLKMKRCIEELKNKYDIEL